MPPSNARAVLSSSIRCRACVNATVARRAFASSPASRSVGPESPRYIEVPKPLQQTAPYHPVVKGSLPVPRNVFVTRSERKKETEEFINAATPEPTKTAHLSGRHAERLAWKQRLSALRRRNLREGVTSLHKRKQTMDQYLAKRGEQRQNEQKRLINQPPRDDEVFTNPSVSKAVRDFLSGAYNTTPEKEVERQRAALEQREAVKSMERKDALHTLYVHARDFIVTEDQLSKVIDDTFGTDDNLPGFSPNASQGRSIWARDAPLSTAEMLANNQGRSTSSEYRNASSEPITRRRIQKIAEELTGGKI
ncbi:hypothetical protein SLS57_009271 [Botryosphaeria dothidea]